MKKIIIALAAAAVLASLGSCKRETAPERTDSATESREMALLTVSIKGNFQTKARDVATQNNEDMLSSVEVFVFDANENSKGLGMLEAYKAAESADISAEKNEATLAFNTSTGNKHIYVIANAGKNAASAGGLSLAESISTEAALKEAISEFSDNGEKHFIMAGSSAATLSAGNVAANKITIDVKRLVARIKVGTITGAFTSPALRNSDFKVKRIYLTNAAKQAKYVNGDATDVFGVAGANALSPGESGYPVRFQPSGSLKYYVYSAPVASSENAAGMYAWMEKTGWTVEKLNALLASEPESVRKMTQQSYTSGNNLYVVSGSHEPVLDGAKMTVNQYFYAYPNSSPASDSMDGVDNTTKVIIETELKTAGGSPITYYYPISVPYLQPNYAYTIGDVKIKRLGSLDPFTPVSTAECVFTIKVRAWDTGDIVGEFNNETSDDEFEI
ncbi:MAG: hypothetical protein IJ652_00835 [Bacteroidales bacterium]|nr:hypothetical protein [Bacteroidales bacterium]